MLNGVLWRRFHCRGGARGAMPACRQVGLPSILPEFNLMTKKNHNPKISCICLCLLIIISATFSSAQETISIGSKKFTESVILGELASHLTQSAGFQTNHRSQLGGTQVLFKALSNGEIDIYPEYTGTISQEILAGKNVQSENDIRNYLSKMGIRMSRPLGFNNTYVIGMKQEISNRLGIEKVSDLRRHPELKFGFSNEFMDRGDGWPSLQKRYSLPHKNVRGLDHDLAYRGLESGSIDVIDLYATDAEIEYYQLKSLNDDLKHFPEYQAVFLYRDKLAEKHPDVVKALLLAEGVIPEREMVRMNARVKLKGESESLVAADFLQENLGIIAESHQRTVPEEVLWRTLEHLFLVGISLGAAILISIPLGIIAYHQEKLGQVILSLVGVIQTIPSLALLVFMIPLLGIGAKPAVAALFLYSLLPIVRNTYTGLKDIPQPLRESGEALGLPRMARLRMIELPMASRMILAGIKTSAIINVGTATLGALIGAGGYGQPILTGIRLDSMGLILQGAIPAALLAFTVQGLFELTEPLFVSKGLRLEG
jgi:osmoprotectant transport system permease protein